MAVSPDRSIVNGNAEARRSLDLFNKDAGTKPELANLDTLDAIRLKPGCVWPPVCEHGVKTDGEHCSSIVCAEGSSLSDDNECETRRTRKIPQRAPLTAKVFGYASRSAILRSSFSPIKTGKHRFRILDVFHERSVVPSKPRKDQTTIICGKAY